MKSSRSKQEMEGYWSNVDLAVKTPRPGKMTTKQAKRNFERECETCMALGLHPHVVSCHYVRRLPGERASLRRAQTG